MGCRSSLGLLPKSVGPTEPLEPLETSVDKELLKQQTHYNTPVSLSMQTAVFEELKLNCSGLASFISQLSNDTIEKSV